MTGKAVKHQVLLLCPRSDDGFTLIELILVIIIGTVAILPILGLFSGATFNSVQPVLTTQGIFLAQDKIEAILADAHAPGRGYDYIIDSNYPTEVNPQGFYGFTIAVTVSGDSTFDGVTYKEVKVTVSHSAVDDIVLTTWVAD